MKASIKWPMRLLLKTSDRRSKWYLYRKVKNEEEKLKKLKSVTFSNLDDLETILKYNIKNNIHFYRLTSKLIPLSTHPEVLWQYDRYFSIFPIIVIGKSPKKSIEQIPLYRTLIVFSKSQYGEIKDYFLNLHNINIDNIKRFYF